MFCTECGAKATSTSKFCAYCGTSLIVSEALVGEKNERAAETTNHFQDENEQLVSQDTTFSKNDNPLLIAAEQGNAEAQNQIGNAYRDEKKYKEAVKWYRKAAEQGYAIAQNSLGVRYFNGEGVEQNYEQAARWYMSSAEQGWHWAQRNLGRLYRDGTGVEQSNENAIKWLYKAYCQGNNEAKKALIEMNPMFCKQSDVILYAVGGEQNIYRGSKIEITTGEITIFVYNRNIVDIEIFNKLGATDAWVETKYREQIIYSEPKIKTKELIKGFASLIKDSFSKGPPDLNLIEPEYNTIRQDHGEGIVHAQLPNIDITDIQDDFFEKNPNLRSWVI